MISELSYVGLVSPNHRDWLDYGPKVLGCEVAPVGPDGATRLRVDDMCYRLAIHPGEEDQLAYVGWGMANERDLEDFVAHLREHDVEVTHADEATVAERQAADVYWFDDPFGIRHASSPGGARRSRARSRPDAAWSARASSPATWGSATSC